MVWNFEQVNVDDECLCERLSTCKDARTCEEATATVQSKLTANAITAAAPNDATPVVSFCAELDEPLPPFLALLPPLAALLAAEEAPAGVSWNNRYNEML